MIASRNLIGCAVIMFILASTTFALTLTSHEDYTAFEYVKGKNQVVNPCFHDVPEDKRTKFNWSPTDKVVTITSCSDKPAEETVRTCPYTLGDKLEATGTSFALGQCTVTKQGVGCVDPVTSYIADRLNNARTLEILSDRFNFRTGPNQKILFVTQTK